MMLRLERSLLTFVDFATAANEGRSFGGVRGFALRKFSVIFFSAIIADQVVLGPVSCPAKIHCTAIFP